MAANWKVPLDGEDRYDELGERSLFGVLSTQECVLMQYWLNSDK